MYRADQIKVAVWAIGITAVLTLTSLVMTVYYSQLSIAESQKFVKWQDEVLLTIKNESQQLQSLQNVNELVESKVTNFNETTSPSATEQRVIDKAEETIENLLEPTPAL